MKIKKTNLIENKGYQFVLDVIQPYVDLHDQREFVLSKQLLYSGTGIGENVEEATAAQSRKDFLLKMSIASKEVKETKYWLRLFSDRGFVWGLIS